MEHLTLQLHRRHVDDWFSLLLPLATQAEFRGRLPTQLVLPIHLLRQLGYQQQRSALGILRDAMW